MNPRMRIVSLPGDQFGVVFDRTAGSSSLPPLLPSLNGNGGIDGYKPIDMAPAMSARFVVWFADEIDLEAGP